ncbi:MAG: alpha/beta hydrolase [Gammaproteobacteria bacterium]
MRKLILMLSVCAFLAGCASFNISENYFFHPGYSALSNRALANPGLPPGYSLGPVEFKARDGTPLHALFSKNPNAPVVLYFGGDDFRIGEYGIDVARDFAWADLSVFMVDYRGYGESQGRPSLAALRSDALAAYDYLSTRPDMRGRSIIVHGHSMGSLIAPYVATERPVAALVLESTATDALDWVHSQIPWYAKLFVSVHIAPAIAEQNNVARLRKYSESLLLMTGAMDQTTPAWMAQKLYQDARTPADKKVFYLVRDSNHDDVMYSPEAEREYHWFVYCKVLARADACRSGSIGSP